MNIRDKKVEILKGERVAHGVFIAFRKTDKDKSAQLRRLGGFGSSGM